MMIDCHAHLTASAFDEDRKAVCERAEAAGVRAILVVGEDREDNVRVREITAGPVGAVRLLSCLGLHPDRYGDAREPPSRAEIDATLQQIRQHAESVVGMAICGMRGPSY